MTTGTAEGSPVAPGDPHAVPAPGSTRGRNSARGPRGASRQFRSALIFIVPGLILFATFVVYPIVATVSTSFYSVRPAGGSVDRVFVGLDWFQRALFEDVTFRRAMRNSAVWATWSVFVDIPLAFSLAMVLRRRVPGWRFYRTAWFVPMLLSPVLVGLLWRSILRLNGGLLNGVLAAVGLDGWARDWLGEPTALLWLFFMTTWSTVGFYMVLILAALEDFPEDLLDAAKVDGASRWHETRHIIIPLLRPVLVTLTIITFVFKMRVFDLVWVTTQGGPYGLTETVITWVVKRAFYFQGAFDLGYPAAMSTIWLVAIAAGIWILRRLLSPKDSVEY